MRITLPKTVVALRKPQVTDGSAIWQLVRETGVLDLNSPYAYILLGEHFAETCIVAEHNDQIAGLVTAYIPPKMTNTLFVWQVGVSASMRNQGLALQMILALLQRESCQNITSIQTSITPSNKPSRALFSALAQAVNGELQEQPDHYKAEFFPEGDHEPESLFTISPVQLGRSA